MQPASGAGSDAVETMMEFPKQHPQTYEWMEEWRARTNMKSASAGSVTR